MAEEKREFHEGATNSMELTGIYESGINSKRVTSVINEEGGEFGLIGQTRDVKFTGSK